jgi:hypothetical protein
MPIFYALIARGKTVLSEFTARSGNFPTITRMLLAKIGPEDAKMSYVYDRCARAHPMGHCGGDVWIAPVCTCLVS